MEERGELMHCTSSCGGAANGRHTTLAAEVLGVAKFVCSSHRCYSCGSERSSLTDLSLRAVLSWCANGTVILPTSVAAKSNRREGCKRSAVRAPTRVHLSATEVSWIVTTQNHRIDLPENASA